LRFFLYSIEYISEKDKRVLQNTMAYGEEGAAMIEETPRPRKPKREVKPEIDRFDEGKPGASARDPLVTRCVQFYCSKQGLIISFLSSG
jgi:hypothetical protein